MSQRSRVILYLDLFFRPTQRVSRPWCSQTIADLKRMPTWDEAAIRETDRVERIRRFFELRWYPVRDWPFAHQRAIYQANAGGQLGRYQLFMFFVHNGVQPNVARGWILFGHELDNDARRQVQWLANGGWQRYANRHTVWDMEERRYVR